MRIRDTYSRMPIKDFQCLLLDNGFEVGGCVDYPDEHLGERNMMRDTFFYKGSALVKTTEFLFGNNDEISFKNSISRFGGHLTFNTQNLSYAMVDEIGGSYGPIKGEENKRYHSVDIRENLFKHTNKALSPEHLLLVPTLEGGVVGMYTLSNLVTRRQCDYSGIMQEELGGSPRGFSGNNQIDSYSFGCYTLAKLMALKENLENFSLEFQDVLSSITFNLDERIKEKMDNHRSQEFLAEKALPVIRKLIENDTKVMIWHNAEAAKKDILSKRRKTDVFE